MLVEADGKSPEMTLEQEQPENEARNLFVPVLYMFSQEPNLRTKP